MMARQKQRVATDIWNVEQHHWNTGAKKKKKKKKKKINGWTPVGQATDKKVPFPTD